MPLTPLQTSTNYIILISMFIFDYLVGNGLIDIVLKMICDILCFTRKVIGEEAKRAVHVRSENPISFPVLVIEILVLTVTIVILNKYKHIRGADRLDELFDESKDALRQTNEFLEKWRMRRVSKEFSYLDEEPQEIKPLKVEVPILHMAIVDTLGTARSLERGDAGDSANVTDSAILSVTSFDDDFESLPDPTSFDDIKAEDFNNRYLWNVMEEDYNCDNNM
ncbi:uncharacterized protein LOC128678353 isoform X1 [Plodia interpunctella]|uniref:uncharacterized protein LOC128678353 isoform X1 n=1 Tax=Plodia interpunctella TaxID=58824 RepID=UPI002367AA1F|nr:uncharacterized protein LOC128678353 isoform X1 [Plodia interpunctella]